MSINTSDIAKLRAQTGAGMLDCKKALEETDGDFDKAVNATDLPQNLSTEITYTLN